MIIKVDIDDLKWYFIEAKNNNRLPYFYGYLLKAVNMATGQAYDEYAKMINKVYKELKHDNQN